ncbi:MAG: AI-2E family transporter [Verrucomicrobiales bacterium]|nr:AI-2E family transporter [Verrucomicrobiales bacterium]
MKNIPTSFQKNTLWTAVTAVSMTLTAVIAVGLIWLATRVIAFLQPILIPFAIAGVLAYLLEPVVKWLEEGGLKRTRAVLLVFATFIVLLGGLGWWVVAKVVDQSDNLGERLGGYTVRAREAVVGFADQFEKKTGFDLLPGYPQVKTDASAGAGAGAEQSAAPLLGDGNGAGLGEAAGDGEGELFDLAGFLSGEWVQKTLPVVLRSGWNLVKSSLGGFLGAFGFLLSMIIVPLYLYYFLIESAKIKETWADYLPLRASRFKDEVVDCLMEINGYLIAFFRGQLLVSMINGAATGLGLMIVGLDFAFLIGLALCVLGIIPYLGIMLCWIPAVLIASFQGGSGWIPADPWWVMPLVVTGIFVVWQQIDGFFITPKIVGETVGLHPMTVIVAVLLWTMVLGGLLGAILAVPLTASVKVLFQRYVWRARLAPQTVGGLRHGGPPQQAVDSAVLP